MGPAMDWCEAPGCEEARQISPRQVPASRDDDGTVMPFGYAILVRGVNACLPEQMSLRIGVCYTVFAYHAVRALTVSTPERRGLVMSESMEVRALFIGPTREREFEPISSVPLPVPPGLFLQQVFF